VPKRPRAISEQGARGLAKTESLAPIRAFCVVTRCSTRPWRHFPRKNFSRGERPCARGFARAQTCASASSEVCEHRKAVPRDVEETPNSSAFLRRTIIFPTNSVPENIFAPMAER
jgi:hypothetical protein